MMMLTEKLPKEYILLHESDHFQYIKKTYRTVEELANSYLFPYEHIEKIQNLFLQGFHFSIVYRFQKFKDRLELREYRCSYGNDETPEKELEGFLALAIGFSLDVCLEDIQKDLSVNTPSYPERDVVFPLEHRSFQATLPVIPINPFFMVTKKETGKFLVLKYENDHQKLSIFITKQGFTHSGTDEYFDEYNDCLQHMLQTLNAISMKQIFK